MSRVVALVCVLLPAWSLVAQDKPNEPPPGFVALFNGQNLDGWQGVVDVKARAKLTPTELADRQKLANEKFLPHWTIDKGVLHYDGKGNSLQTAKDYGNFELLIDWQIEHAGDSGIYLRGNPQVQVWDSDNAPGAKGNDKGSGSGGLWNNKKLGKRPLKKADKPVGEWNTFRIIMVGDLVTIHLNGELVVDKARLENYWEPGKPLPARGPIELQHHGDKLWFRNIFVKRFRIDREAYQESKRFEN